MTRKVDTLIIGAGISGLTVAYELQKRGVSYRLLEKKKQSGGLIRTTQESGFLAEWGPNTFMVSGEEQAPILKLIQELNLSECLVEANAHAQERYIYKDGTMHSVPASPKGLLGTSLLSRSGKLRALVELYKKPRLLHDETVTSFVTRRLGQEVLDYLIEPMLTGIYAGDPAQLSMACTLPTLFDWEKQYRSVIRGALKAKKAEQATPARKDMKLYNFTRGMAVLPEAICSELSHVEYDAAVTRITRRDGIFFVESVESETEVTTQCERLIIATSCHAASPLIENMDLEASNMLRQIPLAPVVSATIGFRHAVDVKARKEVERGFGVLVPHKEGLNTLGIIFNSTLFNERGPDGSLVLTAMLGGQRRPRFASLGDDEIVRLVMRDLSTILGIKQNPDFVALHCFRGAIPQYTLGHKRVSQKLDQLQNRVSGLYFTGNYIDGISLPHCVARGLATADAALSPQKQGIRVTAQDEPSDESAPHVAPLA